jgi:hypothetical protein
MSVSVQYILSGFGWAACTLDLDGHRIQLSASCYRAAWRHHDFPLDRLRQLQVALQGEERHK